MYKVKSSENMASFSYKDHEYRLSPMHFIVCCWDMRSRKPTALFWVFVCIMSFIIIHWYYSSNTQGTNSQVLPGLKQDALIGPDINPKFRDVPVDDVILFPDAQKAQKHTEQKIKPDENINLQEDEYKNILEENMRNGMPPQLPIFDNKEQDRGDQRHPPQNQLLPHPSPKEFPVAIVNEPVLECGPNGYLVILLVENRPDNTGARLAIRNTWGIQDDIKYPNVEPQTWKTIFVMGSLRGLNADYFHNAVDAENKKYGDILQGDFEDTKYESTRKFMLGLQWVYENRGKCPTKFILKTRDDIFTNMHSITEWLIKRWGPNDKMLYIGKLLRQDQPIRHEDDPLYVAKADYRNEFFPDMIEKPVYLFDWLAFEKLYLFMKSVIPIAVEDGYIGLVARNAGLKPKHNDHFQLLSKPSDVCHHIRVFFLNRMLPKNHLEIFKANKNARDTNQCPGAKVIYGRKGEHFEV